jgi:hydrogenase maturation protease
LKKCILVKTLIVGLGNPILGDDGVGWQIATEFQQQEEIPPDVTIECMSVGGISLMESLIGYDRAIIIDSIVTHQVPVGTVNLFKLEDVHHPSCGHMSSAHDTSLPDALMMGRSLGARLPSDIMVVTVESEKVYEFSETLTPPVAAAIPEAMNIIKHLLLESRITQSHQTEARSS